MSQGNLRMKYPTDVNSNTEKNSHVFYYIPFILTQQSLCF